MCFLSTGRTVVGWSFVPNRRRKKDVWEELIEAVRLGSRPVPLPPCTDRQPSTWEEGRRGRGGHVMMGRGVVCMLSHIILQQKHPRFPLCGGQTKVNGWNTPSFFFSVNHSGDPDQTELEAPGWERGEGERL